MSSGLPPADRLSATRAELDALAHALGRVDIEAIEASAQSLARLFDEWMPAMGEPVPSHTDAAAIDDLRWQVERCRRLWALPARLAGTAEAEPAAYRPDGQPQPVTRRVPRLEVAG